MDQRTHTWMAVRAVALLEDSDEASGLVQILKPRVKDTAIGAWIPDLQDSKAGSGDVDNHILKMKPYDGSNSERFIVDRSKLLRALGSERSMHGFLKNDSKLSRDWWSQPYRADPKPGEHLANRVMALTTTLIDLLILGDTTVARIVPGSVRFARRLHDEARSRREQIATYFFMLSHFVADSLMPCHCDARPLSSYSNGLHKELEKHWSRKVGTFFDKSKLLSSSAGSNRVLSEAKKADENFGISLDGKIPTLGAEDPWEETVMVCRGSFAVASIIAHPDDYPYGRTNRAAFSEVFAGDDGKDLLREVDAVVAHDAVLNIAAFWKNVWSKFD